MKKVWNTLLRIFTFGLLPKDRNRYGVGIDPDEADYAEAVAVDRIRKATHPKYQGHWRQLRHAKVEGEGLLNGYPVLAGGVGGYYIRNRKQAVVVWFEGRYKIEVWIHECAHFIEDMLKLAPPWHFTGWHAIFVWWRTVATMVEVDGEAMVHPTVDEARPLARLPLVEDGDEIEVDFADGDHHVYICRCGELEDMCHG